MRDLGEMGRVCVRGTVYEERQLVRRGFDREEAGEGEGEGEG